MTAAFIYVFSVIFRFIVFHEMHMQCS